MELNINEQKKIVEVWLTKQEQNDAALQAEMKPFYANYKRKGYLVAVFQSGDKELYPAVLGMLAYNKKRGVQVAGQQGENARIETIP